MDELKRALQTVGGSMQELENTQRAISRDLKAAQKKSDDMATQMGELRGAFAGLAALVERLWLTHEDHEARIRALEKKAS